MYKMTKQLEKLIECFPTKTLFCEKTGVDEATLSHVLADRRPIPQSMMAGIQSYLGWPLDNLFEIKD